MLIASLAVGALAWQPAMGSQLLVPQSLTHCTRAPAPIGWAGEGKFGKFGSANVPEGVPTWAFGVGLAALFLSNFGVVLLVAAERASPGSMPPINAITDISNAAMERAVQNGETQPMLATMWANGYFADVLQQYFASHLTAQDFIGQWCAEQGHYDLCMSAKQATQARVESASLAPLER